jgi:hypothetical protein
MVEKVWLLDPERVPKDDQNSVMLISLVAFRSLVRTLSPDDTEAPNELSKAIGKARSAGSQHVERGAVRYTLPDQFGLLVTSTSVPRPNFNGGAAPADACSPLSIRLDPIHASRLRIVKAGRIDNIDDRCAIVVEATDTVKSLWINWVSFDKEGTKLGSMREEIEALYGGERQQFKLVLPVGAARIESREVQ